MSASPILSLTAEPRWAALAAGFARDACRAAGFDARVAEGLALAAEEVVAAVSGGGAAVTLALDDRHFAARLRVTLPAEGFDTAWLSPLRDTQATDDDFDLEGLGVYVAARLVDRLTVERRDSDGALLLAFEIEREFPVEPPAMPPADLGAADIAVADPDDALLALFARWAAASGIVHEELTGGGDRLVGRRAAGEIVARIATDGHGRPVGAVMWTRLGDRLVLLHGPLMLPVDPVQRAAIAAALIQATFQAMARSPVSGIVALYPPPELPAREFEPVGMVTDPDGSSHPVLFRALDEDPGATLWVPPDLRAFVEGAVRRLGLGRELAEASPATLPATGALLAAIVDRDISRVVLRPLLPARDAGAVVAAQLRLFRGQGVRHAVALLSLGRAGDSVFAAPFLEAGMKPRAFIPAAGSDLLVLADEWSEAGDIQRR
ncbi:MAG: hypothetical protein AB7P02_00950 [Alphaproteobacteria bacterium]